MGHLDDLRPSCQRRLSSLSALAVTVFLGETTFGGLVDGPVYKGIYDTRAGLSLLRPDTYAAFQNGNVVYHDDIGDYSTNEPTLDGTAGLSYYFSTLEKEGRSVSTKEFQRRF